MRKYFLAWFPMVLIAIVNGTLREAWYGKQLSELRAHQVSTASGVLLFGLYIWILLRIWKPASPNQALTIGFMWLCLTVAFEFLFFHYVMGHPWSRLLHDYNVFAGRVWAVILMWVTIAPYGFYRLQQ
jgi:hypothetical protein